MQSIHSAVFQTKYISQVMFRYQCHIIFPGKISLGFSNSVAEREKWKFKHDDLIVSGSQPAKKAVELKVEGFAVGMAEKIVASNFNQDYRVASNNIRDLIHGRFNSSGWFGEIDYFEMRNVGQNIRPSPVLCRYACADGIADDKNGLFR